MTTQQAEQAKELLSEIKSLKELKNCCEKGGDYWYGIRRSTFQSEDYSNKLYITLSMRHGFMELVNNTIVECEQKLKAL